MSLTNSFFISTLNRDNRDIKLSFDGNSIVAGYSADFAGSIKLGLEALLLNKGDTRLVTIQNVGISGQSTATMRNNASDIANCYDATKNNILVAWELYNQFREPVLSKTETDPTVINNAILSGISIMQGYCQDRKSEHSDWKIVIGTPPPDKYNGNDSYAYPPRANFYSIIQVPVRDSLKALVLSHQNIFDAIADVTSDTRYDPSQSSQSSDGVHPNSYGLSYGNITNRFVSAIAEVIFQIPQPPPVI